MRVRTKRLLSLSMFAALAVPSVGFFWGDDNLRAECSSIDKWSDKQSYYSGTKVKFKGDFDDAYIEYKCTSSTKEGDKDPSKDRDHWEKVAICCKC